MRVWFLLCSFMLPVLGCGGGAAEVAASAATFTIGGTISGLSGTVVLKNSAADDLTLTAAGSFTFATGVAASGSYAVTVGTQPDGLTCSVSNGTGTVSAANVTNVSIVCAADTYTVGGTISGLSGTVVLQNNAADALTLTADGAFTFATAVADGAGYDVTVSTQPGAQTCSIASSAGTISAANVTNVTIVCATDTYTVGGTISGLTGTVVLQNNSGNDLTLTANGALTFTTAVADGAAYTVTVKTQPTGASCSLANASGTISGANVTNVTVTCSDDTFTVGGTISGLSGTVVLQNNSGDSLSRTTNGAFTFATAIADDATYAVTVLTQPSRQECTLASASGTIDGANVTGTTLTCINVRKMFVTSTSHDGNLKDAAASGIAGADAKCASDINHPGDGNIYKALLVDTRVNRYVCTNEGDCTDADACDPTVSGDWVLAASTKYTRTNGTVIGTTTTKCLFDVFDSVALTNSIGTSGSYWTGVFGAWVSGLNCFNWTSSEGGGEALGRTGLLSATGSTGFANANTNCDTTLSLVCVEQ